MKENLITTLAELVESRAQEEGSRTFLHCDGQTYSFGQLYDHSAAVAMNLAARGLKEHDKIVLLMGNCVEFLYSFLGLGRIGAVCVPVNPLLKPQEIAFIVNDADARMIVTVPEFLPFLPALRQLLPMIDHVFIVGDAPEELPEGVEPFSVLLEPPSEVTPIVATPESEASLIYTSGTTGNPKGVVLTHRNYLWNAIMLRRLATITSEDLFFCVLPMFHVNAQVVTLITPLVAGGNLLLMKKFNPFAILPMIAEHRPTIMSAVPTIYHVICSMPKAETYDLSSMRFFVAGAAPLPEETYKLAQRVLKKPMVQGYGLSEATCASAVACPNDPIKWNSVGPALAYCNLRIVDPETGADVPVGAIGEIVVSGPTVMKGYYKNPEATAEVLENGWLHTGDLGRFDEDGYLFVEGRIKDMIIRGGQNVYPLEIENVLGAYDGVEEACVVGVPEPRWGQEILAAVKMKEGAEATEEALMEHCRKSLAAYKCPRFVRFVDELPKTTTAKVKKGEVAEQFRDVAREGQ